MAVRCRLDEAAYEGTPPRGRDGIAHVLKQRVEIRFAPLGKPAWRADCHTQVPQGMEPTPHKNLLMNSVMRVTKAGSRCPDTKLSFTARVDQSDLFEEVKLKLSFTTASVVGFGRCGP